MGRYKKIIILAGAFLTALSIAACGQAEVEESAADRQEGSIEVSEIWVGEGTDSEIKGDETENAKESSVNQQESNVQTVDNKDNKDSGTEDSGTEDSGTEASETEGSGIEGSGTEDSETEDSKTADSGTEGSETEDSKTEVSEKTAEELLELFIDGSISAVDPADLTSAFYMRDLDKDSYSIGEKVDLDNDGENELIICGPYGGMYLDARDDKVYWFAGGDGTALILSYTCYNGYTWIMYSNRSSAGFEFYHLEKFEGADNLAAEMNFGEEFDINNPEAGLKYTLNGAEISYDEYTALCSKIFAAEVQTEKNRVK